MSSTFLNPETGLAGVYPYKLHGVTVFVYWYPSKEPEQETVTGSGCKRKRVHHYRPLEIFECMGAIEIACYDHEYDIHRIDKVLRNYLYPQNK